jgi:hypothetical protein
MMYTGRRDISLVDALVVIEESLQIINFQTSGESFLQMIENTSGIILEREPGIYSFAFLGFSRVLSSNAYLGNETGTGIG